MENIGEMNVAPPPGRCGAFLLVKANAWELIGVGIALGIGIALGMTFFLSLAKAAGWITA